MRRLVVSSLLGTLLAVAGAQNSFGAQCGQTDGSCVFSVNVPYTEVSAPDTNGLQGLVDATNSQLNATTDTFDAVNGTVSEEINRVQSALSAVQSKAAAASATSGLFAAESQMAADLASSLLAEAETLVDKLSCVTSPAACQLIPDLSRRVDCHPDPGVTRDVCLARGCLFDGTPDLAVDGYFRCYYPPGTGYALDHVVDPSNFVLKKVGTPAPYGQPSLPLKLTTSMKANATLRVQITDSTDPHRFTPEPLLNLPNNNYPYHCGSGKPLDGAGPCDSLVFATNTTASGLFGFTVSRASNGRTLFDTTSIEGLMFTDQFIQLPFHTASRFVYGFGENTHQHLLTNMSRYKSWPMFARDEPPNSAFEDIKNLYGVHPFYLCVEPDGKAHGVLILNSNAQEVTFGPGPGTRGYINYRTIGGQLDLYFFPGPTPDRVVQQYHALIGTPMLPAYWGLGFQISRWGYNTLANVKKVLDRNFAAGVPQETQVFDIDYMAYKKDFTYDTENWANITSFVNDYLHKKKMHLITILDPAIDVTYQPFLDGKAKGLYVEWENQSYVDTCRNSTNPQFICPLNNVYPNTQGTKIMLGTVWPNHNVAFPDWLGHRANATQWWIDEIQQFHRNVSFDGLWIDMNEPANFATNDPHAWYFFDPLQHHANISMLYCPVSKWDHPPYDTLAAWNFNYNQYDNRLYNKTLCMAAVQGKYRHYDVHSLYGWSESQPTQQAVHQVTGKRGAVISRSTFVSSGRYTGHWLGDNSAGWDDLRTSLIGCVEFGLFGVSYIGADVCGFNGESEATLCLRWQQAGALYSFYRNHNGIGHRAQDPSGWDDARVANATRKAVNFRYYYLPYLYSLMHRAHTTGLPAIRAFFFDFPDPTSLAIDEQVTWGGGLVWSPVLYNATFSVTAYFPNSSNFFSLTEQAYGQPVDRNASGWATLPAPYSQMIPVHAARAKVYPRQAPAIRLADARLNPLDLLLIPDDPAGGPVGSGEAIGTLFWDNGEDVSLNSTPGHENYYFHRFHYFQNWTTGTNQLLIRQFTQAKSNGISIPTLDRVELFSYRRAPNCSSFLYDDGAGTQTPIAPSCSYNSITKILVVKMTGMVDLSSVPVGVEGQPGPAASLSWSYAGAGEEKLANREVPNPNVLEVLEQNYVPPTEELETEQEFHALLNPRRR